MCRGILMNCKLVNENMISDLYEAVQPKSYNQHNKPYIDKWVGIYYEQLFDKFSKYQEKITGRDYSKCDILHESLLRQYEKKEDFKNETECFKYLNNYFKIKNK